MYIKRHVKHITKQNGIDETAMALHVENLARRDRRRGGGQTNAQRVGIRRGDIIVGFGERTDRFSESGVIGYVLQEQAKSLPVKLLRKGEQIDVTLSLE